MHIIDVIDDVAEQLPLLDAQQLEKVYNQLVEFGFLKKKIRYEAESLFVEEEGGSG